MALRTNYKDDVYSGNRKYSMTTNPDTTISFTDETDYTQQGDTYGAAQINEQNTKINDLDNNAYRITDTAENSLADGDYVPFYDASASGKRRVTLSKLKEFLLGALAPKVHDSNSAGTYGAGTGSKFGHVKLSDSYTTSGGAANSSVGASSQAVYDAYRNRAPVNHASTATTYGRGDASNYGHVKLNDAYSSNSGAASAGVGASGKAVYDAYTNLNGKINTANSNISGLSNRMGTAEGNINSLSTKTSTIENELTANNNRIYMDYKDGKYGYNTDPNRGAGSFVPFKNKADMISCLPKDIKATCSHGADFAYGGSGFTVTVNFSGNVSISGDGFIYKNNVSVGQSTSFVEGDVISFNLLVSVQTGGEGTLSSTITWS